MSQRIAKVESVVRQTVATALSELLGPEGAAVTVTAVEVSPDLRHATVWIGVVGADPETSFKLVREYQSQLQRRLAGTLTTKFVPRLELRLDSGGEYAAHVTDLLRGL